MLESYCPDIIICAKVAASNGHNTLACTVWALPYWHMFYFSVLRVTKACSFTENCNGHDLCVSQTDSDGKLNYAPSNALGAQPSVRLAARRGEQSEEEDPTRKFFSSSNLVFLHKYFGTNTREQYLLQYITP